MVNPIFYDPDVRRSLTYLVISVVGASVKSAVEAYQERKEKNGQ